jgi:Fe2+ or Zn2+ uptake regulation protein
MIKLKSLLKEDEQPKTFFEIRREHDPDGMKHDLRLVCLKCGTTETCRCSKPKRTFEGICNDCAGIDGWGNKL